MKQVALISVGCLSVLAACQFSDDRIIPSGAWKVDSVHTHYNGFSFMRKDVADEPLIEYLPGGKLKLTKNDESRFFRYELKREDSLFHCFHGNVTEKFLIHNLTRINWYCDEPCGRSSGRKIRCVSRFDSCRETSRILSLKNDIQQIVRCQRPADSEKIFPLYLLYTLTGK